MRAPLKSFRKLVLVCQNDRPDGSDCCMRRGAQELYPRLKDAMRAADPSVRVSRTGCLGVCLTGPTVVIMPDNIWLGEVQEEDIPEIVRRVCADLID